MIVIKGNTMNEKLQRLYRLMVLYLIKNSIRTLTNTEIMTFVDKISGLFFNTRSIE